jgi:hypothetical protein
MPEHTCAGMHDLSCEACWEDRCRLDAERDELPGESRYAADYEPEEWDVVGGL